MSETRKGRSKELSPEKRAEKERALEAERNRLADLIRAEYTPEDWAEMTSHEAGGVKIGGKTITTVGRVFSISGNFSATTPRLQLGLAIWPGNEVIQKKLEAVKPPPDAEGRSVEQWRERIQDIYTPEKWAEMTSDDALGVKIDGKAITALGTLFGIAGNPYLTVPRLELGLAIWPSNEIIQRKLEVKKFDPEAERNYFAELIRAEYTPEKWTEMTNKEAEKVKIDGKAITALGTLFGIAGNPYHTVPRLELGLAIWPGNEVIQKKLEAIKPLPDVEGRSVEQWRERIQGIFTAEKWAEMTNDDAKGVKIDGKSIIALGTLFGIVGYTRASIPRLHLGLAIWPGNEVIQKKLEAKQNDPEAERNRIADLIRAEYKPEEWVVMTNTASHDVKIDGKAMGALGTLFEIVGDPYTTISRLKIGLAIWPGNKVIRGKLEAKQGYPEAERNRLADLIRAEYTPEDWAEMTSHEAGSVKIGGKTITTVGRVFSISGNFSATTPRLELGLAIWPGNEVITEKLQEQTRLKSEKEIFPNVESRTIEEWRERIQSLPDDNGKTWTPEEWAEMTSTQASDVHFDGKAFMALGRVFSISGNFSATTPRLQLGLAIWPGNEVIQKKLEAVKPPPDAVKPPPDAEGRSVEQWRERIQDIYTPEKWAEMTSDDSKKVKIDGKAIKALGNLFEIAGNPQHTIPRLQLGLAIWPGNEIIERALEEAMAERSDPKLREELKEFAKSVAEGKGVDAETFRALITFCGGARGLDILYQFKPEYEAIHVDFVKSVLAEYLGDVLSEKRPFELKGIEKIVPFLSDLTLQDGLFETLKGDCLSFYYKNVREGSNRTDRDIVEAYLDHAVEELGHLDEKVIDDVIERVVLYFNELFKDMKKPAGLIEEITPGRAFPDVNQRINARELKEKKRLLIADEMGLGKSASVIFAKETLGIPRALIVVPSNVGETWRSYLSDNPESGGYFKSGHAPRVLIVEKREDLDRSDLDSFDYILLSQERLRDDYLEKLKAYDFGMLIVDESHKLKNPKGKRGGNIVELSKRLHEKDGYVALLSGTPVPNTVRDVGMVLRLLYPEKFEEMDDRSLAMQIIRGDLVDLRSLLLPRMQMKSLQESVEMPKLEERIERIALSPSERAVYDILLEEDEITATQKMQLMRQFLLNPELVDPTPDMPSTKIEAVGLALRESFRTKKKVVLFVNGFVEHVIRGEGSIIEKLQLPDDIRIEVVHGEDADTKGKGSRADIQERFQKSEEKMLLIVSGQTADVGVDYSAGEEVMFYNEPWTETQRRQQLGRVYRPGLTRDLSSTTFLVEGTLEEGIHRHLAAKYKSIEKLLHGIPLAEIEKQLLEKSDASPSVPGLEVNPDLAEYYFSSWDKLMQIFAYVKDIGEKDFQTFLEKYSRDYADSYIDMGSRSYQANASRVNATLIKKVLQEKHIGKETRILDLASGPEMLRRHISDEFTDSVVSVDINADHFRGEGGARIVGSMIQLPLRGGSFDIANLSLALQYASFAPSKDQPERLQVLMEMNRILKTGGQAIINTIYSLDIADEVAFKRITALTGFRLVEEESGLASAGSRYRSRLYSLEKVSGEVPALEDLLEIIRKEKLDKGLKFKKNDASIKDQRKVISAFTLVGKEYPIELNESDRRIYEEEQKLTKQAEDLKERFGNIEAIPREEVVKVGFSRVFNGKRYVLFKRLTTGSGAVIVK